jgi:hypothetical protein
MRSCTPGAYEQLLAALSAEEEAKVLAEEAAPSPKPAEWEKAQQWETWVGWRLSDRSPKLAHDPGLGRVFQAIAISS